MSADVYRQATPMKRRTLSDEHRRVLVDGSGILPGIVKERGYYTLKLAAVKMLVGEECVRDYVLGAESWLGIPIHRPDGTYYGDIIRLFGGPDNVPKYVWPTGQSQVVDVHPSIRAQLSDDPTVAIMVIEGIKKADAVLSRAMQEGIPLVPVAVNGCWGWIAKTTAGSQACPDFRDIPMNKRIMYVNSDSDFKTNDDVRRGWSEAALYFSSKTEDKTKALLVVTPPNGLEKQGADDFFKAGGTLTELLTEAVTPRLALLDNQTGEADLPRPVAFRTGIEVLRTAPEKVPYLMEPLIPEGSINLMAGHSGTYKTWHMLSMMLDLAFGYAWTDHPGTKVPTEPATSIYINKEMSGSMLDVRLKQLAKAARYTDHPDFEAILSERVVIVEEAEIDLNVDVQRDRIEELIVDVNARMVFLDSLSMCWTGDENNASEVAQFFNDMRGITERTGVAWGLVHHLVKPPTGNRQAAPSKFAVRGSGQIVQQADSALLFSQLDSETANEPPVISITHVKTRTTAEMPTWVSSFTDHDGLWSATTYKGPLSDRKAAEYTASHGDPAKFAEWVKTALESMPVMHPPHGPGLRTKNLITLLQTAWPDKKNKAPSDSTIRRHLEALIASGDMVMLESSKRHGDLYRMNNVIVMSEEELPELEDE